MSEVVKNNLETKEESLLDKLVKNKLKMPNLHIKKPPHRPKIGKQPKIVKQPKNIINKRLYQAIYRKKYSKINREKTLVKKVKKYSEISESKVVLLILNKDNNLTSYFSDEDFKEKFENKLKNLFKPMVNEIMLI